VSLVRSYSSLFGLKLQLKLPYITSFILLSGTLSLWINFMVLVPFTLPSLSPYARRQFISCRLGPRVFVFWMPEELAVIQVHVCFRVMYELGSFGVLCGST
jgi:hypothetical protein